MNSYSAFDQLVQNAQRQFESCQPSLALREWEQMDRQLRDAEHIDRMSREIDRIARITRETELFRECAEPAVSRHAENLQFHEKLRASEESMRQVYSQPFVDSLVRTQEVLSRLTTQVAGQQAFLSRVSDGFLRQAEFARTIESFAERIIRETALQEGLVSRLMSGFRAVPSDFVTTNYDELLNVVMRGFEETGLTQSEVAYQTVLWRFDAWLDKFPPNVRNIVIALIFTLFGVVIQEALDFYKSGPKALPAAHENQASLVEPERVDANLDMCR